MQHKQAEELVRRLAAALRGTELYSPAHPIVQVGVDALSKAIADAVASAPAVIGSTGDEVAVDGARLPKGSASLVGFARDLREREIEKVTFARGTSRDEIRGFVRALADRQSAMPIGDRLIANGVRNITIGK